MRAAVAFAFLFVFAPLAHADDAPAPPAGTPAQAGAAAAQAGAAAAGDGAADADGAKEHGGLHIQLSSGGSDSDDESAEATIARLPPDVRSRLTGQQIESILRNSHDSDKSAVAILVPLGFFLTILGIVVALAVARHRREAMLHDTLHAMIERGTEIPEALLTFDKKKPNDRRRGIVFVGLGLGLTAFLFMVDSDGDGAWAVGLVPLLLGIGYLAAWYVEHREK